MADDFIVVTWTAGDIITEAKLDNMTANDQGFQDGSAIGDSMIITRHLADASVTGAKLGLAIACRVRRNANQAAATGAWTALSWDVEEDDDGGFYAGGAPTRLTIPATGWYALYGWLAWANSGAGAGRYASWHLNGNAYVKAAADLIADRDTVGEQYENLFFIAPFTANDYLELKGLQDTGGNLNMTGSAGIIKLGTSS